MTPNHKTMADRSTPICPVCGAAGAQPFAWLPPLPIACNVLWETAEAARDAPRGQITLCFCDRCGHIFNTAFDPALMRYNQTYENSLHYSTRFQEYAFQLVDDLVDRYDIRNCDIVEIGAGQGDFLQMICNAGGNRGVGYDPSYTGKEIATGKVNLVADYYDEESAAGPADVILCRHVLEHIANPAAFMAMVRRVIGERPHRLTFFEVPNALWTILQLGVWDIIYEHCGYFTPQSLKYLFVNSGFGVGRLETVFGGQFLTIEAQPDPSLSLLHEVMGGSTTQLQQDIGRFGAVLDEKITGWNKKLAVWRAKNQRAVIWGAGSKGVTFLNMVESDGVIDRAVDINPRKHGMHISGTGQPIIPPDALRHDPPDHIVIMNPNYHDEIGRMVEELGIAAGVHTV